jgi:phosphoribosyl 1,2-cyclic phosphodiesterase
LPGLASNMIEIRTLASGSTGNCYWISDGKSPLLIECGIRFADIRQGCGFKLSELAGCLCTHEHQDHCKAAKDILKAGIDIYLTEGTAQALDLAGHRVKIIKAGKQVSIGSWTVLPFEAQHDAEEPVGFLMQSGAEKLLYLTDSYFCRYKFKGLTHIMIECNYSLPRLNANIAAGLVPSALKHRIRRSHFSLENVKEFLKANDLSRVREIHLIHLSDQNSDEALFVSEIQRLTGKPVYVS